MKPTTLRAAVITAAVLLGLGAFAAGNQPDAYKTNEKPANRASDRAVDPGQNKMIPTDTTDKAAVRELNATDRGFLTDAYQISRDEVQMAKLAEKNASSAAVKRFSKRLVDDHSRNVQQLEKLARKYEVVLPKTEKASDELDKLTNMKGVDFDQAFVKQIITDHQQALDKFQKEVKDAENPDLKQFASTTVPTLEEHLKMGRELKPTKEQQSRKPSPPRPAPKAPETTPETNP